MATFSPTPTCNSTLGEKQVIIPVRAYILKTRSLDDFWHDRPDLVESCHIGDLLSDPRAFAAVFRLVHPVSPRMPNINATQIKWVLILMGAY